MTLILMTLIPKYSYPNISGSGKFDKYDIIFTKSFSMHQGAPPHYHF